MKVVWIVNHYAQAPDGAGGTRHYQLAKALRKRGWIAYIIAASTVHKQSCYQRLGKCEPARLEYFDGIPFLWLRTPSYTGNGLGRILNMLTFTLRLLTRHPQNFLPVPDVVIGSSVHPFAAWSAQRLACIIKVPFIFEVRDLWPQTLIDFGVIAENGIPAMLFRALESFLYRKSCKIITLLPYAHRYIKRYGISPKIVHCIPNGVDISAWEECKPPFIDNTKPLQLMYFGAFGRANALDVLIRAMHELQHRDDAPDVTLRLIGDGPSKSTLIEMVEQLSIPNISFEPSVPKSDIPKIASDADVFVLNLVDSPLYTYGISLNKLFDYMAASRPIIFGCSAANNPVAAAGAGITVPPANPSAFVDAIYTMASYSHEKLYEMGIAGRAYVEAEHNSETLGGQLADSLNDCIGLNT